MHRGNVKLGPKIGNFEGQMSVNFEKNIKRKYGIRFLKLSWGKIATLRCEIQKSWFKIYWCTQIYIKVTIIFQFISYWGWKEDYKMVNLTSVLMIYTFIMLSLIIKEIQAN